MSQAWCRCDSNIDGMKSWPWLQGYASSTLAHAASKLDLQASVTSGAAVKKQAMSFLKRFRKNCTDVVKQMADVSKCAIVTGEAEQRAEGAAAEAAIIQAAQPPVLTPVNAIVNMALFASDVTIPAVPSITVNEPWQFNKAWVFEKFASDGVNIGTDLPYGINANVWLCDQMQKHPKLGTSVGRFLGDFIGSSEYHSHLGRGAQGLQDCGAVARQLRDVIKMDGEPALKFTKALLDTNLKDAKQRAHILNLLGEDSLSAWGIAPGKSQIIPEQLGLGVVKMQTSGFSSMIVLKMSACVNLLSAKAEFRNNFTGVLTLKVVQDMITNLKAEQIPEFIASLEAASCYKLTLGAGSAIIIPPGWFVADQTQQSNAIGLRCVYGAQNVEVLKSANHIREQPSAVLKCPLSLAFQIFHR